MLYMGAYCGVVEDAKDPEKLGRLKVRVSHIYGALGGNFGEISTDNIPWALPSGLPSGLTQASGGIDWLPEVSDQVIVQFLDGEPEKPVWSWLMQTQRAAKNFPLHSYEKGLSGSVGKPNRGALVRYGHTGEWNADGLIFTTSKGYRILLTDASSKGNDGDILISTQAGQYFEFDDEVNAAYLNVTDDWHINTGKQMHALCDSISLNTMSKEIELISGTDIDLTAEEDFNFKATGDWLAEVAGAVKFTFDQSYTLKVSENLTATIDGTASISSQGPMDVDFSTLSLGQGASQPFVLGTELFSYLTALYTALVSHTHSGVMSGPSETGTMLPPVQPPTEALLSTVIKGK